MAVSLLDKAPRNARALIPLAAADLKAWLREQSPARRAWVEGQAFSAAGGALLLLPGADGAPEAALLGVDRDQPLWSYAVLPGALPAATYRIEAALPEGEADQAALGWLLGAYRFARYKSGSRGKTAVRPRLVMPKGARRQRVLALAAGIALTRDLVNTPANDMGPAELAAAARALARHHKARCKVILGEALLKQNYPAVHAVGRASDRAPRLIDLRWGSKGPKVTLVGKGVCFDSGGLDLKSAAGMKLMKKDMGGAAHVLGLAAAIMGAGLKLRLRVLVPAVENAVSGNAMRPLDVVPTRKGLTIEIGNTDAEGRVILSDALTEGAREKPDLMIDFATLTGAARIALGTEVPALFCNDDDLAERLAAASQAEGDPLWRLPLHAPYRRLIKSKVADLDNAPAGGYGGAITAALFLEAFVEPAVPWAHFDVMAWNTSSRAGRPEGGEAMAFRAVYRVIEQLAENA